MDQPTEAPAGLPKARRKIFQCSECDEVFVDEESLRRHELTHRPAPSEEPEPDDAPAPAPRAGRGRDSGVTPAAAGRGGVPLSAVREQAGIDPPGDLLSGGLGPSALDAQVSHLDMERGGLGPMSWEDRPARGSLFKSIYTLIEDFSEFLFKGLQKGFGALGFTLVPALGLALKGIILLSLGTGLLISGMYVGRRYGPGLLSKVRGSSRPSPNLPANTPEPHGPIHQARETVSEFYAAIDRGNHSRAYEKLSPAWRRALSYEAFERGYRATDAVRCKIDRSRKVDSTIEVDFSLLVTEKGHTNRVSGTYVVCPTSEGWKLDSGSFRD